MELPDSIWATGASFSCMLEWGGRVLCQKAQDRGEQLLQIQNLSTANGKSWNKKLYNLAFEGPKLFHGQWQLSASIKSKQEPFFLCQSYWALQVCILLPSDFHKGIWSSPPMPLSCAQFSRAYLLGLTTATRNDSKLFP